MMGIHSLESCQSKTPTLISGPVGPPETRCSQRQPGPVSAAQASPCTLPGATEPEVTRSWRRRPGRRRDEAAERDRKVSRKREAQVQDQHLLPAPHPLEASPPWAGGSWSQGRRAELSGPGGWWLEALRSCTWGRSLSAQAWASL